MAANDSITKTISVAVLLCLACSVVVSGAAVFLKPLQTQNKSADKQKNILQVAGLYDADSDIEAIYAERVEARIIDLETAEYVEDIDPNTFDIKKAAKDPAISVALTADQDIASIKRKSKYSPVYLIKDGDSVQYVILPVHGYGLWSTMYGFIALEQDLNTVYGITFYEHAETPGLGGEIDNPNWKKIWQGKKIYNNEGQPALNIMKGNVNPNSENIEYEIDGLAGATLTSRGVSNMLQFWFSKAGFKTYLEKLEARG